MSQTPGMYPPNMGQPGAGFGPPSPGQFAPGQFGPGQFSPGQMGPGGQRSQTMLWVLGILGGVVLFACCGCGGIFAMGYYAVAAPAAAAQQEARRALTLPEVQARVGNTDGPTEIAGHSHLEPGNSLETEYSHVGSRGMGTHTIRVENQGGGWVVTKSVIKFNDNTTIDLKAAPTSPMP